MRVCGVESHRQHLSSAEPVAWSHLLPEFTCMYASSCIAGRAWQAVELTGRWQCVGMCALLGIGAALQLTCADAPRSWGRGRLAAREASNTGDLGKVMVGRDGVEPVHVSAPIMPGCVQNIRG